MAKHPVCQTCRWYDHNANFAHNAGLCRISPPRLTGQLAPHGSREYQYPQNGVWPIVYWEDWCAEHEVREGGE